MSTTLRLLIISMLILIQSACTQVPASPVSTSPTILSQTQNGLEMQLVASYRDGDNLWVTLCYQQPNGKNWIPAWHPDDATISVAGNSYPMSSLELIGFQLSQDGLTTYRCDRFMVVVPEQPGAEIYHLTVERLVGKRATSADCPEVQRRLQADNTGIKIECLPDPGGFFSYGLLERPANMTDLEASYVVDDHSGEVVAGPWKFSFSVVSLAG